MTAVDTNIFLDILRPNPLFVEASGRALLDAMEEGAAICEIVYAELSAHFESESKLGEFLSDFEVQILPSNGEALFHAGRAWSEYRRRGGKRERIVPDFIIGAHAERQCAKLLSRDTSFYRLNFPALVLIEPEAENSQS